MIDREIMQELPHGEQKTYFLFDCGAFIIPYLKYNLYSFNRINITPFIYMLETYFQLTAQARDYRCFFFIDNGVPEKIEAMYSAYKGNRKHSLHRSESRIVSRNILTSNEYVANRTLITQFFTYMGEGCFYFNEADYQLGYVLKKMIEQFNIDGTQCYVMSHDKDIMALIGHCNCIRRLSGNKKNNYAKYWFYPKNDYDSFMGEDGHVESYNEFIIRKALLGDSVDNILPPIMVKPAFVKKLFGEYKFNYGYYELNLETTFEIILDKLINKKVKITDSSTTRDLIEEKLAKELRRNYLIFDVYNSEQLFKPVDRRFMDVVLENVLTNNIKRDYNGAYELLKRVSHSHANIFQKWFHDMKSWHEQKKSASDPS